MPAVTKDRSSSRLSFRLPLDPARLLRARHRIRDYLHQQAVDSDTVEAVVLAIEEAMTNAVRHSAATDNLEVRLRFEGRDLLVGIEDHGRGFDIRTFDRTRLPDPMQPGGRGLYLMARLMDRLELQLDGGLAVLMRKLSVLPEAKAAGSLDSAVVDGASLDAGSYREARQRLLVEEIGEAFAALDWEYRFTYGNKAASELYGMNLEDALGRSVWEVFPGVEDLVVGQGIRAAMELGVSSIEEFLSPAVGRWLECRIYPTSSGVSVYLRDIDERKRKELERDALFDALRESRARYQALIETTSEFIWEMDTRGTYTYCSPQMETLWGIKPDEMIGRSPLDLMPAEDRRIAATAFRKLAETPQPFSGLESVAVVPGGRSVNVETSGVPFFDDDGTWLGYRGVSRDVTERKQADEQRRRELETTKILLEAAEALASSPSLAETLDTLGDLILRAVAHRRVTVSLWDETRSRLTVTSSKGEASVPVGLEVGLDGLSERARSVVDRRRSEIVDYDGLESGMRGVGERIPSHLALDVPLIYRGRLVGVLAVDDADERREFTEHEIRLIEGVAAQTAVAVEHGRLLDEDREKARLGHALTTIDALVHSSLRSDEIIEAALRDGAEALGAQVALVTTHLPEGFRIDHLHGGPKERIGRLIPDDLDTHGLLALTSGQTLAIDDTRADPRVRRELMDEFEVKSLVVAPLITGGEPVGCLYFVFPDEPHRFMPAEVDFVRRLAASLSLALENAALYEEQRGIATTLQRSFVHTLPTLAHLEVGLVETPASKPALIGGDFWDLFELRDKRVVVIVGDVAGKGVPAAAMTETVRSTMRAFAHVDATPAFILRKTNELLLRHGVGELFVTALVAVVDVESGHVSMGSAGHPGPVHLLKRSCLLVDPPYGTPLGTFPSEFSSDYMQLGLDDYLLLYTDGVTEATRDGELFGERRLIELVGSLHGSSAQDVAEEVRIAAEDFAGRLRDDLLVVALRLR